MNNNSYIYYTLDSSFAPESIRTLTDLAECVKVFSDLPNRVLTDLQWLPGSPEEKKIVEGIREIYYWTEQWLSYYLFDQKQIKSHLLSTDGKHFQSHAQISVAQYQLCIEAYRYPGWARDFFCSSAGVWLSCEYESCLLGLENAGLIGKPLIVSKEQYKVTIDQFWKNRDGDYTSEVVPKNPKKQKQLWEKQRQEREKRKIKLADGFSEKQSDVVVKSASPFYMLMLTAFYLAEKDPKFREVYQDWIRANKRHASNIKRNKNLHSIFLTSFGEPIDTQSNANLPGSRLKKRRK
ncbi:MAG: hypothetical protein U7127_08350 [Phormidium sp.]